MYWPLNNYLGFEDFVHNTRDGMVWGHGITPGPNKTYYVRTLCKMDPATLKVELVHSGLEVLTVRPNQQ
jgi:hypothetical protein